MDEIIKKLENMDKLLNSINDRQQGMEVNLKQVDNRQQGMEINMNNHFQVIDGKINRIEAAVTKLEESEAQNIRVLLKQIDGKIDKRDSDIQALNKRVFKTESEIEQLKQ